MIEDYLIVGKSHSDVIDWSTGWSVSEFHKFQARDHVLAIGVTRTAKIKIATKIQNAINFDHVITRSRALNRRYENRENLNCHNDSQHHYGILNLGHDG